MEVDFPSKLFNKIPLGICVIFLKFGKTIRLDEGKPNEHGHEAHDHYHWINPKKTGKKDYYLDGDGNPVPKFDEKSHLYPPGWVW